MVKVKEFSGYELESQINAFLRENQAIEIRDIKYAICAPSHDGTTWEPYSGALVLYEEGEKHE